MANEKIWQQKLNYSGTLSSGIPQFYFTFSNFTFEENKWLYFILFAIFGFIRKLNSFGKNTNLFNFYLKFWNISKIPLRNIFGNWLKFYNPILCNMYSANISLNDRYGCVCVAVSLMPWKQTVLERSRNKTDTNKNYLNFSNRRQQENNNLQENFYCSLTRNASIIA